MELTNRTTFSLRFIPGQPGIQFDCEGDPVDQMQLLISAMEGNDHARSVILSVNNYWIEKDTIGMKQQYNKLLNIKKNG